MLGQITEKEVGLWIDGMNMIINIWNRVGVWVAELTVFLMMVLTASDVFGRYVLKAPISGTGELTEFMMVVFIFLALSDTTSAEGHITVEFLTSQFSARNRAILKGLTSIISGIVIGIVAWRLGMNAFYIFNHPEVAPVLRIPKAPFMALSALGCASACIAFLGISYRTLTQLPRTTAKKQ